MCCVVLTVLTVMAIVPHAFAPSVRAFKTEPLAPASSATAVAMHLNATFSLPQSGRTSTASCRATVRVQLHSAGHRRLPPDHAPIV